jgi:hypothetical protein
MIEVKIFLKEEEIKNIFDEVKITSIVYKSQNELSKLFKREMILETFNAPSEIAKEDRYLMVFKSKE